MSLLGVLLTFTTLWCLSFQTDLINRGLLFPCIFYIPTVDRYFYLYSMQTHQGTMVDMTYYRGTLTLSINFCNPVEWLPPTSGGSILPLEMQGANNLFDSSNRTYYGLSYFNGYFNTTSWTIDPILDQEGGTFQGVQIKSTNVWKNPSLADLRVDIYCNPNVTGQAYNQTIQLVQWNGTELNIRLESAYGCGRQVPEFINKIFDSNTLFLCILVFFGLVSLTMGYKVLKWTLVVFGFFLGLVISYVTLLEGSDPNQWGVTSVITYSIFALIMGFILAYSSFYFPSGAIYTLAFFLGHSLASFISDLLDLKTRFFIGYLVVHIALPGLALLFFHKNVQNCKYIFTSTVGAMLLVSFTTRIFNMNGPRSISDFLSVGTMIDSYLLALFALVVLVYAGYRSQTTLYKLLDADTVTGHRQIEDVMALQ